MDELHRWARRVWKTLFDGFMNIVRFHTCQIHDERGRSYNIEGKTDLKDHFPEWEDYVPIIRSKIIRLMAASERYKDQVSPKVPKEIQQEVMAEAFEHCVDIINYAAFCAAHILTEEVLLIDPEEGGRANADFQTRLGRIDFAKSTIAKRPGMAVALDAAGRKVQEM